MCFGEAPPTPTEVCAQVALQCIENGGDTFITGAEGSYDANFGRFVIYADGSTAVCRVTCENVNPSEHGANVSVENDDQGGGSIEEPGDSLNP